MMVRHFESIEDARLSPNDKNKLKDFYLQNMIAPKARKLLEKDFLEGFPNKSNTSNHHPGSSKPTHQDR